MINRVVIEPKHKWCVVHQGWRGEKFHTIFTGFSARSGARDYIGRAKGCQVRKVSQIVYYYE
jgi:hypothetical protein